MNLDLHAYDTEIGKVTQTHLGYEDHGVLTGYLMIDFGSGGQSVGGYDLRIADAASRFLIGVLRACGVDAWEKVKGRTIFVLRPKDSPHAVAGIAPLPTEPGTPFLFDELRH